MAEDANHLPEATNGHVIEAVNLTLRVIEGDGARVIQLIGEVDLASSPALAREIETAEAADGGLVLDLRRLGFIDSSGLNLIARAVSRARQRGNGLGLLRPPARIERVFERAGLAGRLPFVN